MSVLYSKDLNKDRLNFNSSFNVFTYKDEKTEELEIVCFDNREEYFDLIVMEKDIRDAIIHKNLIHIIHKVLAKYIMNKCNETDIHNIFKYKFLLDNEHLGNEIKKDKELIKNFLSIELDNKFNKSEHIKIIEEVVTDESIINNVKRNNQEMIKNCLEEYDNIWKEYEIHMKNEGINNDSFYLLSCILDDLEEGLSNFWFTRLLAGESKILKIIDTHNELQGCIIHDKDTNKFVGIIHLDIKDGLKFIEF